MSTQEHRPFSKARKLSPRPSERREQTTITAERDEYRRGNRARIGFLVTRRHEGIFLRCMGGILRNLDAEQFEPVILCSRASVEPLRAGIRREGLRFVPFGDSFNQAVRAIREAACDLIYYWEVGSDALNYFLPFARLAAVQCTSHGSLTTTGTRAIDYFISSELIERPSPLAPLPEGEGRFLLMFVEY